MFAALHRRDAPVANLARVLAGWLIVVLLAQGLAALQARVQGPAHRHVAAAGDWMPASSSAAERAFAAAHHRVAHHLADHVAHQIAHERGEAHHHAEGALLVPADGEAALDAAACVLMAMLAPLGSSHAWQSACAQSAARAAAAAGWALVESSLSPPRRPPRG